MKNRKEKSLKNYLQESWAKKKHLISHKTRGFVLGIINLH